MNAKLKHPVKFSNEGKKMTILDRNTAIDALGAEACERISRCVNALLGADAGQLGELIAKAAMTEAINAGMTPVDIAEFDDDHLPDAIRQWLMNAGITIGDDKPKEEKTRRKKIGSADICALPTTMRVSSPTYGAIGKAAIEPATKWLIDEIIALFPTPESEYNYDDIGDSISPNEYTDSIVVTAEQIGAYALAKYKRNDERQRVAIVRKLREATQSVDMFYTNAKGEDRHYVGSLLAIDAPHADNAAEIDGLQFPITIRASNVFRLYFKSSYGRISLQKQRMRLTHKDFAEYEDIKCWAISIEPYRKKEITRSGSYTRVMPYESISGYIKALADNSNNNKSMRSRIRKRAKEAAEMFAADYSTEDIAIRCTVNGTYGIKFTWERVRNSY